MKKYRITITGNIQTNTRMGPVAITLIEAESLAKAFEKASATVNPTSPSIDEIIVKVTEIK